MDRWHRSKTKLTAVGAIARAGSQDIDDRYNNGTRIPRPTRPPEFVIQQQSPQQYGENASYYTSHPTSPFQPAANSVGQNYVAFAAYQDNQSWTNGYVNSQQHNSPPLPPPLPPPPQQPQPHAQTPFSHVNVNMQTDYQYSYVPEQPYGSPPMDYAPLSQQQGSAPPLPSYLPPQATYSSPQSSYSQPQPSYSLPLPSVSSPQPSYSPEGNQKPYGYTESPTPIHRSLTMPNEPQPEPHDCQAHYNE
jgi:hypothetical protein